MRIGKWNLNLSFRAAHQAIDEAGQLPLPCRRGKLPRRPCHGLLHGLKRLWNGFPVPQRQPLHVRQLRQLPGAGAGLPGLPGAQGRHGKERMQLRDYTQGTDLFPACQERVGFVSMFRRFRW